MNMKTAATLTGSLLARKGAAYPASYSAPTPSPDEGETPEKTERAYNDPRVIASAPPPPAEPVAPAAPAEPVAPAEDGPQMQDGRFVEDVNPTGQGSDPAPGAKEPIISSPEPAPVEEPVSASGPEADAQAMEEPGLPPTMDKMGRVRLSVRLDPDRYLRVKMASARTRWSAQDIVIAALDKYLGNNAENGAAGKGNGVAAGRDGEDAG
jgi:hypothetical protein